MLLEGKINTQGDLERAEGNHTCETYGRRVQCARFRITEISYVYFSPIVSCFLADRLCTPDQDSV